MLAKPTQRLVRIEEPLLGKSNKNCTLRAEYKAHPRSRGYNLDHLQGEGLTPPTTVLFKHTRTTHGIQIELLRSGIEPNPGPYSVRKMIITHDRKQQTRKSRAEQARTEHSEHPQGKRCLKSRQKARLKATEWERDLTQEGVEPNPGPCCPMCPTGVECKLHHFHYVGDRDVPKPPAGKQHTDGASGRIAAKTVKHYCDRRNYSYCKIPVEECPPVERARHYHPTFNPQLQWVKKVKAVEGLPAQQAIELVNKNEDIVINPVNLETDRPATPYPQEIKRDLRPRPTQKVIKEEEDNGTEEREIKRPVLPTISRPKLQRVNRVSTNLATLPERVREAKNCTPPKYRRPPPLSLPSEEDEEKQIEVDDSSSDQPSVSPPAPPPPPPTPDNPPPEIKPPPPPTKKKVWGLIEKVDYSKPGVVRCTSTFGWIDNDSKKPLDPPSCPSLEPWMKNLSVVEIPYVGTSKGRAGKVVRTQIKHKWNSMSTVLFDLASKIVTPRTEMKELDLPLIGSSVGASTVLESKCFDVFWTETFRTFRVPEEQAVQALADYGYNSTRTGIIHTPTLIQLMNSDKTAFWSPVGVGGANESAGSQALTFVKNFQLPSTLATEGVPTHMHEKICMGTASMFIVVKTVAVTLVSSSIPEVPKMGNSSGATLLLGRSGVA